MLVVDDEPAYLEMMCKALRLEGYKALPASSYLAGLNSFILHKGKIDLLITAVALGDRNGCELAKGILPLRPDLRVLFISAQSGAEVCRYYGMLGPGMHFLEKPFTQDEFIRLVSLILEQSASASAS